MVRSFFEGWRFPVVAVTLLAAAVALMATTFLIPPSAGAAYAFAEEFKRWCFGYDAEAGTVEWAYLWMFLVQPLIIGGIILIVWRDPVREALRSARSRVVRWSIVTLILTFSAGFAMPSFLPQPDPEGPADFPGNDIRTSLDAAPLEWVNQESETLSIHALRGRVVVVTSVYASCHDACPQIISQIKTSLSELSDHERDQVTVVAITMDPVKDNPRMLALLAEVHGVKAPSFQLGTGDPAYIEDRLDRYGFVRRRNDETGVIDHANLVHVIDREGRIAFRFSLGTTQQAWLTEAIRLLVGEPAA